MNSYEALPRRLEYNPLHNSDWTMPTTQPELQSLMNDAKTLLQHKFSTWQQDEEFRFMFPPSAFTSIDKPLINYHPPQTLQDNQQVRPLSQNQISSIKQSGTFLVDSNFYAIPYKWKLNSWIYKGSSNRVETFYKDLGAAYDQLYQIPKRITSDIVSLKKGSIRILKTIPNLVNIIIGINKEYDSFPNYTAIFEKERSIQSYKICNRNKLYEYLYVPLLDRDNVTPEIQSVWAKPASRYTQRIHKLMEMSTEMIKTLDEQKKILMKRIRLEQGDERLLQLKYHQEINRVRMNVMRQQLKQVPLDVIDDLMYYLITYEIIMRKRFKLNNEIANLRDTYHRYIDQNYKVKRYADAWREDKVANQMRVEMERTEKEMIENTEREIRDPVFSKYSQMRREDWGLERIKKENPPQKIPNRKFQCTYKLFPPYEVETVPDTNGERYVLIKERDIIVSTDGFGWKFVLYLIRWYTWTRNVIYWLSRGLWGGRLGLKVLFYCKPFNPKYSVDRQTGVIGRSTQLTWNPIAYDFCDTWRDIARDRRQFQEAPDNGFFGKTCSRMCSIFYNYVIRMMVFMFLWLLILKPIVIILNVLMLTVISATAIVWIPIVLVVYGAFNMLIYNFDLDDKNNLNQRISQRLFPLILIPLKLVWDLFYSLLAILGLLFHPLLAFIILLWGIIRITVKSILDFFMLGFIKCCARSPVRDTKMAWKISGPGLSRDYYQTIREQDVYILVLAEIEKNHLIYVKQQYQKEIKSIANYPIKILNLILKPFNTSFNTSYLNEINSSVAYYSQKLTTQFERELTKFPNSPGVNIRFSQTELERYLSKSYEILLNYIRKEGDEFLYTRFQVDKDEGPEELIYKIWISIFGNEQIFEPFEDLDKRFELINDREDDAINSVLKTISGDPQYKQKIVSLKFLKKRKVEPKLLVTVTEVLNSMTRYRQREYGDSCSNVWQGIFFNYNSKDENHKWNWRREDSSLDGLGESRELM